MLYLFFSRSYSIAGDFDASPSCGCGCIAAGQYPLDSVGRRLEKQEIFEVSQVRENSKP